MTLNVLVSAMNDTINSVRLPIADRVSYIVVHQIRNGDLADYPVPEQLKRDDIHVIQYQGQGVSHSRNTAVSQATADICLIADDDLGYMPDFAETILSAFEQYPEDIMTFQIQTPEGEPYKQYRPESYVHNWRSIIKVSMVEVAFRRKAFKERGLQFDEQFDLGAQFATGGENIMVLDALKAGIKARHIPKPIVIHPFESSGKKLDRPMAIAKGAQFRRMFPISYPIMNLGFAAKKYPMYKHELGFLTFLGLMFKGSRMLNK